MTDEKLYLKQVEKAIGQLRARCLGQDTPLTAILPAYAKEKDCRYQAKYIAAQLQFADVGNGWRSWSAIFRGNSGG